jgi:hypothetical protein
VHALSHCQCPRECVVKLDKYLYAVRVVVKDCDCVKLDKCLYAVRVVVKDCDCVKLDKCLYAVRVVVKDCDCVKGCIAALSVVKMFMCKDGQRFL